MHRLSSLVDEAISEMLDDLERDLAEHKAHRGPLRPRVHDTVNALSEAVHIKYHMGWIGKDGHHDQHHNTMRNPR